MNPSVRPFRATLGIGAVAILLAAYAGGAFSRPRLPGDSLGIRRFQTAGISGALRVGQTFRMHTDGLRAIVIRAHRPGVVAGTVRLELRDLTDDARIVRSGEVGAADLVRGNSYRFEFAPVHDSARRSYRLDLSSANGAETGVTLRATRGERFADGALTINGVERWADLAFQTEASTNPGRAVTWVVLVGVSLSWVALAFVLRGVEGD